MEVCGHIHIHKALLISVYEITVIEWKKINIIYWSKNTFWIRIERAWKILFNNILYKYKKVYISLTLLILERIWHNGNFHTTPGIIKVCHHFSWVWYYLIKMKDYILRSSMDTLIRIHMHTHAYHWVSIAKVEKSSKWLSVPSMDKQIVAYLYNGILYSNQN